MAFRAIDEVLKKVVRAKQLAPWGKIAVLEL